MECNGKFNWRFPSRESGVPRPPELSFRRPYFFCCLLVFPLLAARGKAGALVPPTGLEPV